MEKQNLAHLFLQSFIKEIIKNTPLKTVKSLPIEKSEELASELKYDPYKEIKGQKNRHTIKMLPILEKPIRSIPLKQNFAISPKAKSLPRNPKAPRKKFRERLFRTKPNTKSKTSNKKFSSEKEDLSRSLNLSKLKFLIRDPAVTEIECKGSEKPLLVRKGGTIQRTPISLTKKEINDILTKFSAATKIPIIGGTFKAAVENLIMTAVISEILGPRFIIQKRNPFQPLTI